MAPNNTNISIRGQRVVVVGATAGIGLGVALQFAKTGAEVWIVGRNPKSGNEVVEKLKQASPSASLAPEFRFFQADLGTINENLRVADELADAAGDAGIDHLILTQGGPAMASDIAPNADGLDSHFAIQLMSRFVLAHHLTLARPVVKQSVVGIVIAGTGKATFDVNDITLEALKQKGEYHAIRTASRDCTVIDAVWQELAERSPSIRFLHLWPGIVKTPGLVNLTGQPLLLKLLFKAGELLAGQHIEEYAQVPFYLVANPEGQKLVGTEAKATQWNEKPKRISEAPALKTPGTRYDFEPYALRNISGRVPHYVAAVQNEYPLVQAACHYTVVDVNVHARLTQTYVSTANVAQEVKYIFPLPSNAAVCAFTAVIDGKRTIRGVVKQKDEAKHDYDQAVSEGRTAGLLDQHTADVFQVTLGNLRPGEKIAVSISYASVVSHEGKLDTLRLTCPLSIAPNYGAPPPSLQQSFGHIRGSAAPLELTMSFSMASNIMSVTSQTHPIALSLGTLMPDAETAFDATKAHVALTTSNMLDQDVVVVLKANNLDHPRCVVERASRQDDVSDAIALTLVPRFNIPPLPEQEYIFLIDRSGSMGGGRIAAVRTALQIMLRSLPSRGTTFNLFSFGTHCNSLWPASVEYASDTVEEATTHVDHMNADYGGTEIRGALRKAFASRPAAKRTSPTMVLLLTDGEAWDLAGVLQEIQDAVAESKGALRVFVLGVGNQVSTNMCDGIARAGRGVAAYVGEQEKPDAKLMTMLKAARGAAVEDVIVEWVPAEPSEQPDDFEFVDTTEANPSTSAQPAPTPISLFDTDSGTSAPSVLLGPQDIPADLPPVPRIQQSDTSKLGALYPGFRTSLFAIVKQSSASAPLPEKVTVRGKVMGAPVQLEVPISISRAPQAQNGEDEVAVDFVHVLAARALVQELEDVMPKTALVRAQITRLGTTYNIASSQTSFVAVDTERGPMASTEPDVAHGGQSSGTDMANTFASYSYSNIPALNFFNRPSNSYAPQGAVLPASILAPSPRLGGSMLQMQAQQSYRMPQVNAQQFQQQQQMQMQYQQQQQHMQSMQMQPGQMGANYSPSPLINPPMVMASVAPRRGSQPGTARAKRMSEDVDNSMGADSYQGTSSLPGPSLASIPIPSAPRSRSSRKRSTVASDSSDDAGLRRRKLSHPQPDGFSASSAALPSPPATLSVESLARLQRFDGSFAPSDAFFALLFGVDAPRPFKPAELTGLGDNEEATWSTLLAIACFQHKFADEEDGWALIVEKAKDFVLQQVMTGKGTDEGEASGLINGWIQVANAAISAA
ncbi:hypothetical protein EXIGLDRAFT_758724 [Exidia glandulosa HHB12029]|uniref:VIT-domain-containing protein n=1 Tax=Exidia glandulosa HHB12029 TaxID=1314781 RepID=A0A165R356_EXIGL|nr:hypothetical protein EXIGLDRAFT_758724 [Exidia glandulosa HHB12029]